ncbi:uncharacterized protein VTP21DRAFT_3308 [Calcarisporiella thermophila]|uniref:uncharacterized protein n=1 Tax=Calcarisporiella thermophila TaxID=911321 RepID=UPI003742C892
MPFPYPAKRMLAGLSKASTPPPSSSVAKLRVATVHKHADCILPHWREEGALKEAPVPHVHPGGQVQSNGSASQAPRPILACRPHARPSWARDAAAASCKHSV